MKQAIVNLLFTLDKHVNEGDCLKISISSTFDHDTLLPFRDEDLFGEFVKIMVVSEQLYEANFDKPILVDAQKKKKLVAGLGIAIVCGSVNDFGGKFYLHGDLQKPTGFTLYLPQVKSEVHSETKSSKEMLVAKILVVDNDLFFVQMLKDLLGLLGYQADYYENGSEVIEQKLSLANEYDILLIDYSEKELKPLEVIHSFTNANPNLKILLTSSQDAGEMKMIADLQGYSFIEKPFNFKLFSDTLKKLANDKKN